jgi:hypothetical protein
VRRTSLEVHVLWAAGEVYREVSRLRVREVRVERRVCRRDSDEEDGFRCYRG